MIKIDDWATLSSIGSILLLYCIVNAPFSCISPCRMNHRSDNNNLIDVYISRRTMTFGASRLQHCCCKNVKLYINVFYCFVLPFLANKLLNYHFENSSAQQIITEHWTLGAVRIVKNNNSNNNNRIQSEWKCCSCYTSKIMIQLCNAQLKLMLIIFFRLSSPICTNRFSRRISSPGNRKRNNEWRVRRRLIWKINVNCLDLLNIPQRNPKTIHFGTSTILQIYAIKVHTKKK